LALVEDFTYQAPIRPLPSNKYRKMNGVLIYLKPAKSPLKKESKGTPSILLSLSFFLG